jgi:DNA-binding response OmpR family regulator
MRILVAEDEFLVAISLEEDLRAAGHTIVGPFTNLKDAMASALRDQFDLAVLDINLGGQMVFPLAQALLDRKIPFVFLSGYGTAGLPERFRSWPRIAKPYDPARLIPDLERALRSLSTESRSS